MDGSIFAEYIRKQLQEDIATDQISIKEYVDPFEKEEKEKESSKENSKENQKTNDLWMGLALVAAIIVAIGLFVLLPFFISEKLHKIVPSIQLRGLIEGVIRVAIFLIYILMAKQE